MDIFPKEIEQIIFQFLDPDTRHSARLTNKEWHKSIPKAKYLFRITSASAFEEKMEHLAQMPDQLALKFAYNNKLKQKTIENSLSNLKNLVSLDFSTKDRQFGERQTYLDRLEYLKIYRPAFNDINSLTRIRQLEIRTDRAFEGKSVNISTTIEDLAFTSTSYEGLDLDSSFQLNESHSRLTRLIIEATDFTGQYASLTRLKSLRDLIMKRCFPTTQAPMDVDTIDAVDSVNSNNLMEDIISMTGLTKLVLGVSLHDVDSEKLAKLTGLRSISIRDYKTGMSYWKELSNLEEIQIASQTETGCTLENLPAEKLTKLMFSINQVGYDNNKIIEQINRLHHLKTLDLTSLVLFNFDLTENLISLPNLESLTMAIACHSLDLRQVPNLKTLVLSLNQPLQRLDLPPNLEKINLRTTEGMGDNNVRAAISPNLASLAKLKELCVNLTKGNIDLVHENISKMTQLEHLELNVENSVLDEAVLQRLTNLTTLQLDMDLKTNYGNGSFLSSMTNLNKLVLSKYRCNNECIIGLSKFGNLTFLNVRKPAEDIAVGSVTHLTTLQCLAMPIDFEVYLSYNGKQEALKEKLPFLELFKP